MVTRLTVAAILMLVVLLSIAAPAFAAEGGGEGAEAINPVNAKPVNDSGFRGDLTIWTAVVFLVVLAILYKSAWGPISEGLQKRESEIAGQIAEAQRKNEEARQLLADYEKKLAAAQDEVRGLIEQGRRDAEKVGQQLLGQGPRRGRHRAAAGRAADRVGHLGRAEGTGRAQRHPGRGSGRQDRRRPAQSRGSQPADRASGERVRPLRDRSRSTENRTDR